MVGWHHRLNGHEFEQAQGDGEGQGSLPCCSPWGHRESDTTERLNKWRKVKLDLRLAQKGVHGRDYRPTWQEANYNTDGRKHMTITS